VDEQALYEHRFDPAERAAKARVWSVLCEDFFQRWVRPTDTVLDLGAGLCEFINHIRCAAKYALDANPEIAALAAPGITTHCGPAHRLEWIDRPVDVVFCSNFFEHMPDKAMLLTTLREVHRVLRPGGRLLILQPNIRYAYREYWDFFDHHVPLSHVSMVEALALSGFAATEVRPRFLPFTTKSALPQWPILIRLYLRLPPAQWLLGKQMFIAAAKRQS
jgi:ubiquinone/menaquinone biosynthesis C-methylase UbiE